MLDGAHGELFARAAATRAWVALRCSELRDDDVVAEACGLRLLAMLDDQLEQLASVLDAQSPTLDELSAALKSVEVSYGLVENVYAQRRDARVRQALQLADAVAHASFATFARAGSQPPLVVLANEDVPAVLMARSQLNVPAFGSDVEQSMPLPLPVVYLPPSYALGIGQLVTLHHEVGHLCDQQYGVTAALRPALEAALGSAHAEGNERGKHTALWLRWLPELIADATGVVLGGAPFAVRLAFMLHARGRLAHDTLQRAYVYPPGPLRLRIVDAMLALRGTKATVAPVDGARFAEIEGDVPHVAALLLGQPIAELAASTLGALAEAAPDAERTEALAAVLSARSYELPAGTSVRLLPGAVHVACAADGVGRAAVEAHALVVAGQLDSPAPVPSSVFTARLAEQRTVRPPVIEEPYLYRKTPPAVLLLRHERAAFVGASHGRLPNALRAAFAARGRPFDSIDVFALEDAPLSALGAELVAERDEALRELATSLPQLSGRWSIRLFSAPYFFASFWDWELEVGRIHVSGAIWGLPLARCPGHDYLRGPAPGPAYIAYVEGLRALSREARHMAGSSD